MHTVYFLTEVLILGAYILVPYYVLLLVVSIVDFWSISEFTVSLILWVLREYILDFMHHIILFLTTSESFVLIFLLHLISTMCQCGGSILWQSKIRVNFYNYNNWNTFQNVYSFHYHHHGWFDPPSILFFKVQITSNEEPWVINQRIFDILNTFLQPNATLSPMTAAQEIDKLFPLNRPREKDKENEGPESFLWEMWGVVISVAEQIPWKHLGQTRLEEVI